MIFCLVFLVPTLGIWRWHKSKTSLLHLALITFDKYLLRLLWYFSVMGYFWRTIVNIFYLLIFQISNVKFLLPKKCVRCVSELPFTLLKILKYLVWWFKIIWRKIIRCIFKGFNFLVVKLRSFFLTKLLRNFNFILLFNFRLILDFKICLIITNYLSTWDALSRLRLILLILIYSIFLVLSDIIMVFFLIL